MAEWSPFFVPGSGRLSEAAVWLRLPRLPMELWGRASLWRIASAAGRPVLVDETTELRRRMGFARVKVVIDASKPLVPGVLLRGDGVDLWQQFIFESLPEICFECGRIGHGQAHCRFRSSAVPVDPGMDGPYASGSVFGPWLSTIRLRPSAPAKAAAPARAPGPVPPPVSSHPASSSADRGVAGSSAAGEEWLVPSKVARRASPAKSGRLPGKEAVGVAVDSSFSVLLSSEVPGAAEASAVALREVSRLAEAGSKRARVAVGVQASSTASAAVTLPASSSARGKRRARIRAGRSSGAGVRSFLEVGEGSRGASAVVPMDLAVLPGGAFGGRCGSGGVVVAPRGEAAGGGSAPAGEALEEGEVVGGIGGADGLVGPVVASLAGEEGSCSGSDLAAEGVGGSHLAVVVRVKAAMADATLGPGLSCDDSALPMVLSPVSQSGGMLGDHHPFV